MPERENPFTPSFGEIPEHLAGRRDLIADFKRAFGSARRRPELTSLFSGARGMGKTTLLSVLAHQAEGQGWISVNTTALPGMLDDIELEVRRRAQHLLAPAPGMSIASVGIPDVVAVSLKEPEQAAGNWRSRMTGLLDQLETAETGLLITVDELDPSLPEMIELAAVYQHFIREDRKVALLMAGLPHNVSTLLNDKTVSFLRRAQQYKLGRVADYEVREALFKTVVDNGRAADSNGLDCAVKAIAGFPFLIQLVGYRAWDVCPDSLEISAGDFERGIDLARAEMNDRILEATYRELSPADLLFAEAMLQDEEVSRTADLVDRLGWSSSQVAQYRRRLIEGGVIAERGRGLVAFDLPFFKEYLTDRREDM